MKWKDKLLDQVIIQLAYLNANGVIDCVTSNSINVHLAIFGEPFLTLILRKEKTIESRFSISRTLPFAKVHKGDLIIIKKSGGDVVGAFTAGETVYITNLTDSKLNKINDQLGREIGWNLGIDFLQSKKGSNYLSLIWINQLFIFKQLVKTDKGDRTAWAIIKSGLARTLFENN